MAKKLDETNSVSFYCKNDKLNLFIDKIKDLTKISNDVIIKINKDDVLMYSYVNITNTTAIVAFKYYKYKTNEMFTVDGDMMDLTLTINMVNAKKSAMGLSNLSDSKEVKIKMVYNPNDYNFVRAFYIEDKLKVRLDCGISTISFIKHFDYSIEKIEKYLNIKNPIFTFKLNKVDFTKIKKLAGLEKDVDEKFQPLYVEIVDGRIYLKEKNWDFPIGETMLDDDSFATPKKFFSCINYTKDETEMIFYVKDNYMFISGNETNLIVSTELSV